MRNLVTAAIEAKCGVDSEWDRDQTVDGDSERPSGKSDGVCDGGGEETRLLEGMRGMYNRGRWMGTNGAATIRSTNKDYLALLVLERVNTLIMRLWVCKRIGEWEWIVRVDVNARVLPRAHARVEAGH